MGVDTSFDGCGSILRQENKNNEWHLCCYECGLWNKAGNTYDPGKCERHWLVKPLMQIRNWVYGVRSLVETAANTLVHQLNLAANDLSGALPTSWIMWIRLFNFDVKQVPGGLNGGPNSLWRKPQWAGEPEPEEEDDPDETIQASLHGIRVEQGLDWNRRERLYEPFDGLRLVEEYNWRWMEVGEFLGNLKWPEGGTSEEMQQFWQEVTKYLVSDGVL